MIGIMQPHRLFTLVNRFDANSNGLFVLRVCVCVISCLLLSNTVLCIVWFSPIGEKISTPNKLSRRKQCGRWNARDFYKQQQQQQKVALKHQTNAAFNRLNESNNRPSEWKSRPHQHEEREKKKKTRHKTNRIQETAASSARNWKERYEKYINTHTHTQAQWVLGWIWKKGKQMRKNK